MGRGNPMMLLLGGSKHAYPSHAAGKRTQAANLPGLLSPKALAASRPVFVKRPGNSSAILARTWHEFSVRMAEFIAKPVLSSCCQSETSASQADSVRAARRADSSWRRARSDAPYPAGLATADSLYHNRCLILAVCN